MNDSVKLGLAAAIILAAVGITFAVLRGKGVGEVAYYYDLSERRLYTAPTGQIPPLPGVGGASGDGVLAVVYVCGKDPSKGERKVAYLMTYTPELGKLKAQAEQATKGQAEYPQQLQDRSWVNANTLVRTPEDTEWHPISSDAGQAALAVLSRKCEDGSYPTVCSPAD